MLIDLLIVIILAISIAHNLHSGFLRQFWSALGFFIGLLGGRLLESYTLTLVHTPISRAIVTIITIFGLAAVGLTLGEYIGLRLKHHWNNDKFDRVDNGLGCLLSAASVLISVWLIASVINSLPATRLKADVQKSHIISALNSILPPAPAVISDLGKLIDPNGFPDVFVGSEPIPRGNINLPSLGALQAAVNKDKNSVVRISGLGCGGIVSGSGFIVANDLVATNAHVVAGIAHPYVDDVNGRHSAEVIWFDPNLDFAVLKVYGLGGSVLPITTVSITPNTPGAVLGYPGGGNFNASAAAVMDEFEASGHNIYGNGVTLRSVYEIDANVIPGNSGGPLIEENGDVMGVVFAQSTTYAHVGYALAMSKVNSEIRQAESAQQPVSTGQCAE